MRVRKSILIRIICIAMAFMLILPGALAFAEDDIQAGDNGTDTAATDVPADEPADGTDVSSYNTESSDKTGSTDPAVETETGKNADGEEAAADTPAAQGGSQDISADGNGDSGVMDPSSVQDTGLDADSSSDKGTNGDQTSDGTEDAAAAGDGMLKAPANNDALLGAPAPVIPHFDVNAYYTKVGNEWIDLPSSKQFGVHLDVRNTDTGQGYNFDRTVTKTSETFDGLQAITPGNYDVTIRLGSSGDTSEWMVTGTTSVSLILDQNGDFRYASGDKFHADFEFDGEIELEVIWHAKALSDGHEMSDAELSKGYDINYLTEWQSYLRDQRFSSYEEYLAFYESIIKHFKLTEKDQKMTFSFDPKKAAANDDIFMVEAVADEVYSMGIGDYMSGQPIDDQHLSYFLYLGYQMNTGSAEAAPIPYANTYQYIKDGKIHAVAIVNDRDKYETCTVPVRVDVIDSKLPVKVAFNMTRVTSSGQAYGQLVPVRQNMEPDETGGTATLTADASGMYSVSFPDKMIANGSVYRIAWQVVDDSGNPRSDFNASGEEYIQMSPDGKIYRFFTDGNSYASSNMYAEELDEILIQLVDLPSPELPLKVTIPDENLTALSGKVFPVWLTVTVAPSDGSTEPIVQTFKLENIEDANRVITFGEKLTTNKDYRITYDFYDSENAIGSGEKSSKWTSGYIDSHLSGSNIFTDKSGYTSDGERYSDYNLPARSPKQTVLSFGQMNAAVQVDANQAPQGFFPKYVKVDAVNKYDPSETASTTVRINRVDSPQEIYFDHMAADGKAYMVSTAVYNDEALSEEDTSWSNLTGSEQRYYQYSSSQYSSYYEYRYDGGMTKDGTVYARDLIYGYTSTKCPSTDKGVFLILPQWKGLQNVKLNVRTSVAEGYEEKAFEHFDDTIYYGYRKEEQRTYITLTREGMSVDGRQNYYTFRDYYNFRTVGDRTITLSNSSFAWVPGTYRLSFFTQYRLKAANNYAYFHEYYLYGWSHTSGNGIKVTLTEDGQFLDENGNPFVLDNRYLGGSRPRPVVDTRPLDGVTNLDTDFFVELKGIAGTDTETIDLKGSASISDEHVGQYRFYNDPATGWYPSQRLFSNQWADYFVVPEGDYKLTYWTQDPNGAVDGYEFASDSWTHEKDVLIHIDRYGNLTKDGELYAIPNHMTDKSELDTVTVKVNTTVRDGVKNAFTEGDRLLVALSYSDGKVIAQGTAPVTEAGETAVTLTKIPGTGERIMPGFGDSTRSNRSYHVSFATIHEAPEGTPPASVISNLWNSADNYDSNVFPGVSCRNSWQRAYIGEDGVLKDASSLQDGNYTSYESFINMKDIVLDNCSLLVPFAGSEEPDSISQEGEITFKPVNSYGQIREKNHYMIVVQNKYDNKWYALSYADGKGDQVLLKDVSSLANLEAGYMRSETDLASKGYIFTANKVSSSESGVSLQFRSGVKDAAGKNISLKLGTSAAEYLPLLSNSAGTVMALQNGAPASEKTWNFRITKNNYSFVSYINEFLGYKGFTVFSNRANNLPVVTTRDDAEEGRFYLTNPGELGMGSDLIYIAKKPSSNMYDYVYEVDEKYASAEYYRDIQAAFNGDASSGELVVPMDLNVYILTDAPQDEPEQPDNNQYKLVKTYGDYVKTFCEAPDMSTQMVLVYTDDEGKEWALNPKGLVEVATQDGSSDYRTLSAGSDNEWIANNNSRIGGYVSGNYREYTYFGYLPAEMNTGGHMNFVSTYALRKSRLNTYAGGEYLTLKGGKVLTSDDSHSNSDPSASSQLYMMQPLANIRNEVDWETKTSYRLIGIHNGVKKWLGVKDGQMVAVDSESEAAVFDIYSPVVNRYFASAYSDDYEPYYRISSLDDINADDQIVIVYDNPVTKRKEILASAGRDFSPSYYYTLSAWLSDEDSPVDVSSTNDFPRDFRYTHRLDTKNPVKHVYAYTASDDGSLIMALGGASNVIGTQKSASKTQKKYDQVIGLGSGGTAKLTIKTGAPVYYNQKSEVNFFCEDGKFYLRGGKSDAWLGSTTYVNGRYYTSSGQYFEDYETLGSFNTVAKDDRIPVEIYKKGSLDLITVNYYDVNDLDGNPKKTETKSEGLLALMQDEDVTKDGEQYIFVGWTKDKSKAGYLSFDDSCNLYDFNDVSRIASVKDAAREEYGLLGNCNPEATNNVKIMKEDLEDGTLNLYPVYAYRGRTAVVTWNRAENDEQQLLGVGDVKDMQGGADGSADVRERWLGNINIELYQDGVLLKPASTTMAEVETVSGGGSPAPGDIKPQSAKKLLNSKSSVLKAGSGDGSSTATLYFAYHNDDAADLNIKFIADSLKGQELVGYLRNGEFEAFAPTDDYIIDAVYAEQGGSEDGLKYMYNWMSSDHGGQLDNVKGGSTVKIYITTKYQVKYYFDDNADGNYDELKTGTVGGSEYTWENSNFYTTAGTENAVNANTDKADYVIEDKDGNPYRKMIQKTPSSTERFTDENIRRGDYSYFQYLFNIYPHTFPVAKLPDAPEGYELDADTWEIKDSDMKYTSTSDPESDFTITDTTYGTGNSVWSYEGLRYDDVTNTFHLYLSVTQPNSVKITKVWEDAEDNDGIRPSAEEFVSSIELVKQNGNSWVPVEGFEPDITDNGDGTYTVKYADLPDADTVTYAVREKTVEGYEAEGESVATDKGVITNIHEPETVDIEVKKVWDDADDQDGVRPRSVSITLLADGVETETASITAKDGWTARFEALQKYSDGQEIVYTVSEEKIDDYSVSYDGFVITNTYTPGKVSVPVTKIWKDDNDSKGIRPSSITVKLYADGKDAGKSITLSDSNKWAGTFTDLDEYAGGNRIEYTVSEVTVAGYASSVSGSASGGYTITNTILPDGEEPGERTPDDPEPDEPKPDEPEPDEPVVTPDGDKPSGKDTPSQSSDRGRTYRSSDRKAKVRKAEGGYLIIEDNDVPLGKYPTGEESGVVLMTVAAVIAAVVVILAVFLKRRKREDQK